MSKRKQEYQGFSIVHLNAQSCLVKRFSRKQSSLSFSIHVNTNFITGGNYETQYGNIGSGRPNC